MAAAFSDIKAHWAEAAITELARMGVVAGYQDGSFRPNASLTRTDIPTAVGILTGLRTRGVTISRVEEQLNKVRNLELAGASFFFYESIWNFAPESPSDRAAAIRRMFPDPASRPSIAAGWQPIING